LIYENRRLSIYGTAGVLVAFLIIASVVMVPWSRLTPSSFPKPPEYSPLIVNAVISNLTEPVGVGSEGDLTVIATSIRDVSKVVVKFYFLQVSSKWPIGIRFNGENASITEVIWNGDLKANVSVIFTQRIKAVEVGYALIVATVTWSPFESFQYVANDRVWILVLEDNIQVSHEPIALPGQMPFLPPLNATISSP
jgi:hypothetical protein